MVERMNETGQGVEAERAVLGEMLSGNAKLAVAHGLTAEHFSLDSHRRIFTAALAVEAADIITVSDELKRRKQLEVVGGEGYVASLTDLAIGGANFKYHAQIVKRESLARGLQRTLNGLIAEIGETAPEQIIARLGEEVRRLSDTTSSGEQTTPLRKGVEFFSRSKASVDWLVEGIIQRGANGFIAAEPKAGKSWAAIDMAISLATGSTWLGRRVPRPVKTALISREDAPGLTAWRGRGLALTRDRCGIPIDLIATNLWVNTRDETSAFSLDNPIQLAEMIRALKSHQVEFAIFDVFNILHGADENDAQQMREVLKKLSLIQQEAGCSIGVVHHLNKGEGSLMRRLRGSSAIAGWAEWLIGIAVVEQESGLRRMDVIGKAAASIEPIYYYIDSNDSDGTCRLLLTNAPEPPSQSSSAAQILGRKRPN